MIGFTEEQEKKLEYSYKKRIFAYLKKRCETDNDLAEACRKENRSFAGMLSYIKGEAKKKAEGGCAVMDDDEVYGLAVHYLLEDSLAEKHEPKKAEKKPKKAEKKPKDDKPREDNFSPEFKEELNKRRDEANEMVRQKRVKQIMKDKGVTEEEAAAIEAEESKALHAAAEAKQKAGEQQENPDGEKEDEKTNEGAAEDDAGCGAEAEVQADEDAESENDGDDAQNDEADSGEESGEDESDAKAPGEDRGREDAPADGKTVNDGGAVKEPEKPKAKTFEDEMAEFYAGFGILD